MYMLSDGKAGSIWSKEADIWAIGCIVSYFYLDDILDMVLNEFGQAFQIRTGCRLLRVQGGSQYQLYQALRLGGTPPGDWLKFWDLKAYCESTKNWPQPLSLLFDTNQAWGYHQGKGYPGSENSGSEEDCGSVDTSRGEEGSEPDVFLDLIRRMVTTEPSGRSQITQLLDHPFFSQTKPDLCS